MRSSETLAHIGTTRNFIPENGTFQKKTFFKIHSNWICQELYLLYQHDSVHSFTNFYWNIIKEVNNINLQNIFVYPRNQHFQIVLIIDVDETNSGSAFHSSVQELFSWRLLPRTTDNVLCNEWFYPMFCMVESFIFFCCYEIGCNTEAVVEYAYR